VGDPVTIFAVSHELFISNPDHGLGALTVRDGDYLVKASDNEVQLVQDADGVAGGHPVTGWSHHSTGNAKVPAWWAAAVVPVNLSITGYWNVRVTGAGAHWDQSALDPNTMNFAIAGSASHMEGGYSAQFTGTHTRAEFEAQVIAANNVAKPLDSSRIRTLLWPQGPLTVGVYYFALGVPIPLAPPAAMRVHLDRLDGRAVHKPDIYERRNGAWVLRPDQWPAPGAPYLQGSLANGHAYVYDGTTMKPMGTNCYIWTGTQWVTP
jgi:hypothetical protein